VITLQPGDVVVTGTPDGVGFKRTPPRYLVAGDSVTVAVENVGSVTTPIS
jgi:2,4-diketo-3-deoxy-L-fuconate hydrolase